MNQFEALTLWFTEPAKYTNATSIVIWMLIINDLLDVFR